MKQIEFEVRRLVHAGKTSRTVSTKVMVDEFETLEEAVEKLGLERVLILVNYAHHLGERSKAFKGLR